MSRYYLLRQVSLNLAQPDGKPAFIFVLNPLRLFFELLDAFGIDLVDQLRQKCFLPRGVWFTAWRLVYRARNAQRERQAIRMQKQKDSEFIGCDGDTEFDTRHATRDTEKQKQLH